MDEWQDKLFRTLSLPPFSFAPVHLHKPYFDGVIKKLAQNVNIYHLMYVLCEVYVLYSAPQTHTHTLTPDTERPK